MTPLPPLPLVDGAFLIDNSGLELLRCPRLWELQFLRRRVLGEAKAGRNFGSTLHSGWAVRYRQCGSDSVTDKVTPLINEAMHTWLSLHPQPATDFRDYNHACRVMECYNKHYQNESFKILKNHRGESIVENSFAFPFGTVSGIPIVYTGKIDLGIQDHNGAWSHDHKSAFQFGKSWEQSMARDAGQRGYTWALKQTLGPGYPVRGYVVDGVRIRRPKKEDEYTGAAPVDASDLIRIPHYVTDDDLECWRENTIKKIESIFAMHARGFFHENESQCVMKFGPCDFYDCCSIPRAQRENALASNMYEDNNWTPLKQVDE